MPNTNAAPNLADNCIQLYAPPELLSQFSTQIPNGKTSAEIVNEGVNHKIDDLGRIVIPKTLRNKYKIKTGTNFDLYTIEANNEIYVAIKLPSEALNLVKAHKAIGILEELGVPIPTELEALVQV